MRRLFRALACIGGMAALIAPATAAEAQTRAPVDTETCRVFVARLAATETAIRAVVGRTGCEEPTFLRAEIKIARFGPDKTVRQAKRALRSNGKLITRARCSDRPRTYYVTVSDSDGNFAKSDPVRLKCGDSPAPESGNGSSGSPGGSTGTAVGSATEEEVVKLTNQARKSAGCGALVHDAKLRAAALGHSKDMAAKNFFAHNSQDGRKFSDRIKAAGFAPMTAGGENIAFGQPTPAAVVDAWMKSPGHRANILNCSFTHIGVGAAQNPQGRIYWTQDFGRH